METIYLNKWNLITWQARANQNVMALGFFDGLHIGHCEVIKTALRIAKERNLPLTVMSFFPHPKTVISKGKEQVCYLMPQSEKEEMLQKLGVDRFYIVEFDKEFASLLPEQFVSNYLMNLGVVHAVAGFDFSYGYKGIGNMDRLKSDSGGLIETTKVKKKACNGEKISSTCIRERLLNGKVEEIPDFLGRPYEVKCDWDGVFFKPLPCYTLPAPGRYAVTLKNGLKSIKTEVMVKENHEGLSLECVEESPYNMKGRLTILWNYSVLEENVQILKEREFSFG